MTRALIYDASAHLRFVRQIKAMLAQEQRAKQEPVRPLVIVLDNYSVHHSRLVKAQRSLLQAQGMEFFFLPAYCPFLNDIEPLWRQVKYQDLPQRSYSSEPALKGAVHGAMQARADAMTKMLFDST